MEWAEAHGLWAGAGQVRSLQWSPQQSLLGARTKEATTQKLRCPCGGGC